MPTDLILGTAGHIDHGKTALVRALTGTDTDRLPEEKQRGITIELGFAELELGDVRLGIVDVPGHERFVRNMLAGATGVDLALLVVAADDSVKPQTREHLEILRLLDIEAGVIALSKCDVADPEWIDLVEVEVRELVSGTFLSSAPVVRTSARTGLGIDSLRRALAEAAERAVGGALRSQRAGPFRMAIDRSFSIAGHGTVVTGSVQSGEVTAGDKLVVQPAGSSVRVRGLQVYGRATESAHRGQRAAINLAGVHHDELARGQEVAAPDHLVPSRRLTVSLRLLDSSPRSLKTRARIHLHCGTAETMASVVLLDADLLDPGTSGLAQLYLRRPVVATWRQPVVIRSESPVVTIGGAVVLEPNPDKVRRRDHRAIEWIGKLASDDPFERASAALYRAGWSNWRPEQLARTAGIADGEPVADQLRTRGELCELTVSASRTIAVHRLVIEETCQRLEKALAALHRQRPLDPAVDPARLERQFAYLGPASLVATLIDRMASAGRVRRRPRGVTLDGHGPQLSSGEVALKASIVERYLRSGFEPPSIREIEVEATKNRAAVPQLVTLAEAEGTLVQLAPEFYLHRQHERLLRETLQEALADGRGLTLSQIREILKTTRKYAVPICEYLDRIEFTRRQGDVRVLAPVTSDR
ncbi:MAG: selenocysteine-specific translation elongation factor [Pirellulales bacterium]